VLVVKLLFVVIACAMISVALIVWRVKMSEENVMVIPRFRIEECGDLSEGITLDVEPYIDTIFDRGNCLFYPRSEVEHDPSYKQIIPYVLIECKGNLFSYTRGKTGGEDRLHGYRSLGIGGHINEDDAGCSLSTPIEIYNYGLFRELNEEVSSNGIGSVFMKPLAVICDPSDPVGAVHLGLVHLLKLDRPDVSAVSESIKNVSFTSIGYLYGSRDTMEVWSRLCLDRICDIIDKGSE
jgi:predicted NUDIX family phosphoesterase